MATLTGVIFVFMLPGYVFVAAVYPRNGAISWFERLGLSFGLSITMGAIIGIALNVSPFGIRFGTVAVSWCVVTVVVAIGAWLRRMRLLPDDRLSLVVELRVPGWAESSTLDRLLTILLTTMMLAATLTLSYFVVKPRPSERFTEFYLLGSDGSASGYPTRLNRSETAEVFLGIVDHEQESVLYTVRFDIVGVRIMYNTTAGQNETVELNRTTVSWYNVTLVDGQNLTLPYSLRIDSIGLWKAQFLLFKSNDFSSSYREQHLVITVTS